VEGLDLYSDLGEVHKLKKRGFTLQQVPRRLFFSRRGDNTRKVAAGSVLGEDRGGMLKVILEGAS